MTRISGGDTQGISRAVERLVDMIQSEYGNTKLGNAEVGAWLKENADAGQLAGLMDRLDQAINWPSGAPVNSPGGSSYPAGTRYAVIRRDELPY